jgi:hypothetical protein
MHYLTDNPWPAVIVLSGMAIAALIVGSSRMRKLAVAFGLCAGLVYIVSEMVISTAEEIEISAQEILEGFQEEDLEQIKSFISSESQQLVGTAERGLQLVSIDDDFHIRSITMKSEAADEATVRIRANGHITERGHSMTQYVPEYWETTWVREDSSWKLRDATRLHHISHEPRGTFDRN